jgi:hypothetical protein
MIIFVRGGAGWWRKRAIDSSVLGSIAVFSLSKQSYGIRFGAIGVPSNALVEFNNNNSGRKHE